MQGSWTIGGFTEGHQGALKVVSPKDAKKKTTSYRPRLKLTVGSCSFTMCWNVSLLSLRLTSALRCQTVQGARQQPAWRISSSDSLRLQDCGYIVISRTTRQQEASLRRGKVVCSMFIVWSQHWAVQLRGPPADSPLQRELLQAHSMQVAESWRSSGPEPLQAKAGNVPKCIFQRQKRADVQCALRGPEGLDSI